MKNGLNSKYEFVKWKKNMDTKIKHLNGNTQMQYRVNAI